ncbi:ubiquitin carboxyl-terminal hydrolase-like [Mizuhopecten yessoensis]|uniref:Ubiquitin carboxyl-terminal hydrolase n=1 Tax=Mizuhopecten yessoensis TaxID=6573 RepID=A0A210Q2D9_MIZYE|nr:ubiquitin carboxyl-terminal hydrolase-like [Mizuhopecten yessoensis]OWF42839.1 Ubiquitin carboxyl-terminal hydrolase isozyme L3 [Mizuhopecten yessoensis]
MAENQRWIPLESNPDVLNKYIAKLGVPTEWQFQDIYGLDPDLLAMVSQPVVAVMLLYPITEKSKATPIGTFEEDSKSETYFVKQTIGNACGTVAIVHALANNKEKIQFIDEKPFASFLKSTLDKSPEERATCLGTDESMGAAHDDSAHEGQTKAPSADEKVNTHFVAFVCKDGKLYEMNGSNPSPTFHGDTTPDTLLQDSVNVVKKFMERDPTELNFTLMALSKVN